jgi:hypothetical protein
VSDRLPSFVLTRNQGGANFLVDNVLRYLFLEYTNRLIEHGPHGLPASINVVESFLVFSHRYLAFDLRDEEGYLLRLDDYSEWHTAGQFPD